MGIGAELGSWAEMTGEIWRFLRARRKWWLAPLLFLIVLTGGLILLSAATPLGPFIYALF